MSTRVRQKMKCATNLRKIVDLLQDLREKNKTDLLSSSIFTNLINLKNDREASGPLVLELCSVFDGTKFVFNPSTTMQICSHDVAAALGIADSGIVIDPSILENYSDLPTYIPHFEKSRYGDVLLTSDLRKSMVDMEIKTKDDEVIFQKRFTLFIIDQFLCPKTLYQAVNSKWFKLVDDLKTVNSLNWPEIVLGHIKKGLMESKSTLAEPGKQRVFNGCSPVLDVIVFERIPCIQPAIQSHYSLLLEKYHSKRAKVYNLKALTADQILPCHICEPVSLNQIGLAPLLMPPPVENEDPVENEVPVENETPVSMPVSKEVLPTSQPQPQPPMLDPLVSSFEGMNLDHPEEPQPEEQQLEEPQPEEPQPEEQQLRRSCRYRVPSQKAVEAAATAAASRGRGQGELAEGADIS
ncbi:uncharacterized protein LOC110724250 isoform X2 [Chenopodium quinoa]|uniref:uncharacterized protein LOC110724250 isoform X2 n=1 Tax=Chenopodium quinoa TaxID=63459 RepID=UPI000B78A5F6|nr:uncharacterized protein LOC110724250 isoform X2 [Chenopodium quinoa]